MSSNIKKSFDAALAKFMRGDKNIVFTAIVDREGIAISYVAKSRKYTVTSQQVGSIIKAVSFPANDLVKIFNFGDAMAQVFVLQDAGLFQFNLGYAYLVILEKIIGFPINKSKILSVFEKVRPLLSQLKPEKSAMLKELDEKADVAESRGLTDTQVLRVADLLDNLDAGTMVAQPVSLAAREAILALAEILPKVKKTWFQVGIIHDLNGDIKAKLGTSVPAFGRTMGVMFKVASDQLPTLAKGSFLFTFAGYENGDAIFSFPVGKAGGDIPLIMSGYVKQNTALKEIISVPMIIARSLKDIATSDLALRAQEFMNFVTSPVDALKTTIQELLKLNHLKEAKKHILRAVEILLRASDFASAGDFLRWAGFVYFKMDKPEKAKNYYLEAAKNHDLGQAFDKTGDDYRDLANLCLRADDLPNAYEYFTQASFYYTKAGVQAELEKVEEERGKILNKFSVDIKNILDKSSSEVVKLEYISSKISLREELILDILRDLIAEGQIPGIIEEGKGRYLKKAVAPVKPPVKLDKVEILKQQMRESALIQKATPGTEIQNQISNQEAELVKWERTFQQINLPFVRYLEYQETIDKKQFLEQKLKVLSISQPFFAQDGTALRCSICFQEIQGHQPICRCSQNHPAHLNCMSVWIQRQSQCPVCDVKLLPSVLKSVMPNEIKTQQEIEAREAIIADLRTQMKKIETDLSQKSQAIHDFAKPGSKEEDLFKKLMNERDERAKLEMILAQKEKTIQELKSMLKVFKKS